MMTRTPVHALASLAWVLSIKTETTGLTESQKFVVVVVF